MHPEVINHYINTILRSKLLLDEDMELTVNNCELCCDKKTGCSWLEKCKRISVLCLWGVCVYKYRLFGLIATTTPLAALSASAFYSEFKVKRYKSNIDVLIATFAKLHKINREIIKYLKVRELFNRNSPKNVSEHVKSIFNQEIDLIEDLMNTTDILCEFCDVIKPENWKINDLHLNYYNNQEECYENFLKLHDVVILTVSKLLAAIAITVPLEQQATVLNKLVPNTLKTINNHVKAINSEFIYSTRSLTTIQKPLINDEEGNNKPLKPTMKLEHTLSKLLTHLQLTFETAHHIYTKFDQKINIEDLAEEVFTMQEQLTLCEQSLDQFCGIYGILVKRSVTKASVSMSEVEKSNEKIDADARKDSAAVVVFKEESSEEAGDEEYEMYVGESGDDEEGDGFDEKRDFSEDTQSSACLLLVLQELKDRLRERQIMRAKKLGLPLPEVDLKTTVCEETKVIPPPKPPIFASCSDPKPEFTAEIGTSSFANAIKLMAQQRHCEEDIFEGETE